MDPTVENLVVDFYSTLFEQMFTEPFRSQISERLKQRAVERQIDSAADAASQSLTRFFASQQLNVQQVSCILDSLAAICSLITLENVSNPNIAPESVVEDLSLHLSCPHEIVQVHQQAIYGVALNAAVQVLMLVGPVMAEWRTLSFSSAYELLNRVIGKLNQISEQLSALGTSGQTEVDKNYEVIYRDHLLQRFYRVEAGTVRMTTNLNVDIRELFVMPRVVVRPKRDRHGKEGLTDADQLMDLASARESFSESNPWDDKNKAEKKSGILALGLVKDALRNVLVGAPGSGKSTFMEWLQLKLAAGEEVLVAAGKQVIPLLLRVRQLNLSSLPEGAALIEGATLSKDRAVLMPNGWIDRQMKAGRVLFMLDGLDETEPELRDRYLLPWLHDLCSKYPDCRYLISSRPVGYPPGILDTLEFAECDLQDFGKEEIGEYTSHWCTAVRLAQHESKQEAEREGKVEGEKIVAGFKNHPYIRNLARNPLMLSAICLVNYFEGGELPKDRSMLYRLCVEGLLHHWDQRRGIHSEFSLEEKLRACREVALAMQADNRAEYEGNSVQAIFAAVLGNPERAKSLLEHIRYRTGLLLERRPSIFAFAHLTFQEYLAAVAVHEGNRRNVAVDQLALEHDDGRWNEVIALYCGIAPSSAVRSMIELLIAQPDTMSIATVLGEAYLSANTELLQDSEFRIRILKRIAVAPGIALAPGDDVLSRFPSNEVASIANNTIGTITSSLSTSQAFQWFGRGAYRPDIRSMFQRLDERQNLTPIQLSEVIFLLHAHAPDEVLARVAADHTLYEAKGPHLPRSSEYYKSQASIALLGLNMRIQNVSPAFDLALLQIVDCMSRIYEFSDLHAIVHGLDKAIRRRIVQGPPKDQTSWSQHLKSTRLLMEKLTIYYQHDRATSSFFVPEAIGSLKAWDSILKTAIREQAAPKAQPSATLDREKAASTKPRPRKNKKSDEGA